MERPKTKTDCLVGHFEPLARQSVFVLGRGLKLGGSPLRQAQGRLLRQAQDRLLRQAQGSVETEPVGQERVNGGSPAIGYGVSFSVSYCLILFHL